MRFNIYGRFQIEVLREQGAWQAYRLEQGKRGKMDSVVIPADMESEEIIVYLDDIFHELAGLGQSIEVLP
jgi:hypothetical protein